MLTADQSVEVLGAIAASILRASAAAHGVAFAQGELGNACDGKRARGTAQEGKGNGSACLGGVDAGNISGAVSDDRAGDGSGSAHRAHVSDRARGVGSGLLEGVERRGRAVQCRPGGDMGRDAVIVDYGHGGVFDGKYTTAGKQYLHKSVEPNLWIGEGIVNRMIAVELIGMLLFHGVDVFDCVAGCMWTSKPSWLELEQRDTPLPVRSAFVNQVQRGKPGAALVSVHANALSRTNEGDGQQSRGVSVWTSPGQTESDELADALYWGVCTFTAHDMPASRGNWGDGDRDYEASFHMLTKTIGTAVLIESGFFDNLIDARILISTQGQRDLARAYCEGILRYLRRKRQQRRGQGNIDSLSRGGGSV